MDKSIFQVKPQGDTCTCIICQRENVESSDEHIIPKALGGYMHTWKVCKDCNSKFGHTVDPLLVEHSLLTFKRYEHQLKGQSNTPVPNPLKGTYDGEDGARYRLIEEKGCLTPVLIESIGKTDGDKHVLLSIDAQNRDKIPGILSRYAKRNGISFDMSSCKETFHKVECPKMSIPMQIDIANFRLGILKIAYEFTASLFPDYVNDFEAMRIAEMLSSGDTKRLDELTIGGNGLDDIMSSWLGNYIDFSNEKRHYIALFDLEGQVYCSVKLFNVFCLVIKMSAGHIGDLSVPIIAINDFDRHDFDLYTLEELLNKVEKSETWGVEFMEPWQSQLQNQECGIYCNAENKNLCYLADGTYIGTDYDFMIQAPDELVTMETNATATQVEYHVEGAFGFVVAPGMVWVPVKKLVNVIEIKKY